MDKIRFTTSCDQLDLLQKKQLVINDKKLAYDHLETYGYYNIINSYKDPYIHIENGEKIYNKDISFEQIFSLFTLDHNLRNAIMAAMLDLEEHLRAVTAEVIAASFGTDHHSYLKWKNYRDRKVSVPRFSLNGILKTLHVNAASDKYPIKYYRDKYDSIPPWILFKGTYFSTLINFIQLFKDEQKKMLIMKLYNNLSTPDDVTKNIKDLLSCTLFMCLDYRNLAAHGGRIYNYYSNHEKAVEFQPEYIKLAPTMSSLNASHGISRLLILMDAFKYQQPSNIIKDAIQTEINRHLLPYPADVNILESSIHINIELTKCMLVTPKSKIFHADPNCSGIKNPSFMEINALKELGYRPCKKCVKLLE